MAVDTNTLIELTKSADQSQASIRMSDDKISQSFEVFEKSVHYLDIKQ